MRRLLPVLVAAAAWLIAAAAPAGAAWFPPATLDGPSPGVVQFGDLDLARDGTGAAVWLRTDAGVAHVFLARLAGGVWSAPERVDAGVVGAATDPVVAVADKGRLVVAWATAGQAYGAFASGSALSAPAALGGPDALGLAAGDSVRATDVDMAIQGTGFVVFESAGDIRAARLLRGVWKTVPAPLDIEPLRAASMPRVALGADGNAIVAWTEADGVFLRRVTNLVPSAGPQAVSGPGGPADAADVTAEDDGSFAWIAFRQEIGGVQNGFARRLLGSRLGAPAPIGTAGGALGPRIAINGRGVGIAAVPRGDQVDSARLERDVFAPPVPTGGPATVALAASAVNQDAAVAWLGPGGVRGRRLGRGERLAEPEADLGGPAAGDRAAIGSSAAGDFAVGYMASDGHIAVASFDDPPSPASQRTSRAYKPFVEPVLAWEPGRDLWGPQTFRVFVDDREVGRTTRASLKSPVALAQGTHLWKVVSQDIRGQTATSRMRSVRVDTRAPVVHVRISGPRRAGSRLRIVVSAVDRAAGVRSVRLDFGDGGHATSSRDVHHRYASAGRRTIHVRVQDAAGNVKRRSIPLRIR